MSHAAHGTAKTLSCRGACRTQDAAMLGVERLHCATCPVVRRLLANGAHAKADRLMGTNGMARRLAPPTA